jgi:hypothetical protein
MPQETEPKSVEGFAIGDTVEHRLMPGFRMPVQDRKPCEPYPVHPAEHPQYLVQDPRGRHGLGVPLRRPGAGGGPGVGRA